MLKIIAILVLSTKLTVAVETDDGWVEREFPNSSEGAELLVTFAEEAVGNPPDGVRVVVGSLNDEDDRSHVVNNLASAGVSQGFATPSDVRAAAAKFGLPHESALAVARADEERFAFIYRRKPNK